MAEESTINESSRSQQSQATGSASSPILSGDASSAIFLLRDYSKFGLAERVSYHFDLTEALMGDEATTTEPKGGDVEEVPVSGEKQVKDGVQWTRGSGVLRLLEFAPLVSWQRLTRRQKKTLRAKLREFNDIAEKTHIDGTRLCYQPRKLPLKCNPSTRIYFGYEVTRIAFCVDASSSLTSTFGVMSRKKTPLCPLDRLPIMARKFFQALTEPVNTATMLEPWKPNLAVTVLAVYPMGETSETSLLVRDFHVYDYQSAKCLTDHIEEWTYSEVESGISERLARRHAAHTWSIPIYSSNMSHILEAGDHAIQILSSEARPVIVVATDGRSISCEGIVDVLLNVDRVDIPVHVLDLSMPESHAMENEALIEAATDRNSQNEINFLSYDPGGTMDFPLHLSDDSEALFFVCRATGGCFLDMYLLAEACRNTAGSQALTDDPLQQSHSFKRRFAKMNGLQWLVLLSLSPISPTFHAMWGKLIPPVYLQKQLSKSIAESPGLTVAPTVRADALEVSRHKNSSNDPSSKKHQASSKTTFSMYVVSPVRIKALILMRIKEGYRAKQYGLSTHDPDKVFIQFTLSLEFGTVLHYELSYKALSPEDHMVGSAHIKIELSGDPSFVQLVKKDFLNQSLQLTEGKLFTLLQKRCLRLCQVIRTIRRDDILQSYLRPPQRWSDQLLSSDSPFAKRLASLTELQRKLHFHAACFDVVTSGTVPYGIDDHFLAQFVSNEDGMEELLHAISEWSTLMVKEDSVFVKAISRSGRQSTNYCVVEIVKCDKASQLFTIQLEFFGGTNPEDRLLTIFSLKSVIDDLKNVEVLRKQMAPFIAGRTNKQSVLKNNVEIRFHHASWDLIMDPELLSLLTKRRIEIGRFRLLESKDDFALFAKLVPTGTSEASPDDLVQYQIAVLDDRVQINLHMESEGGVFNPYCNGSEEARQFGRMLNTVRRRDQECGRALRSRTNLLQIFQSKSQNMDNNEDQRSSVNRILAYSSRVTRRLRFFTSSGANDVLMHLTSQLILSQSVDVNCERLDIAPDEIIREQEPGKWFLQLYNLQQIMSIVHLSLVDQVVDVNENSCTFRDLTFFTNGVSDLYSKRDDLADDDSTESHISEYMCVSEFADQFEVSQERNFALAAYRALRQEPQNSTICIHDFAHALKSLQFIEISSFLVAGVPKKDKEERDSKLLQSIMTILQPVPGDSNHFFYCGDVVSNEEVSLGRHESVDDSEDSSVDSSASTESRTEEESEQGVGQFRVPSDSSVGFDAGYENIPPPIFVQFQLDNKVATIDDLNTISRSCILKVTVSVYSTYMNDEASLRDTKWAHRAFSAAIMTLLKSYVAEQTLERLRGADDILSRENFHLISKCMTRIQSVMSLSVDVYFYISQKGMMMPAAAPAGGEAEAQEGFHILDEELRSNGKLFLTPLHGNLYFVSCMHQGGSKDLQFWCIISLQNGSGAISIQLYHPQGQAAATVAMNKIQNVVSSCIHITNQQLLLRSLHRSRTSSELLIPQYKHESSITSFSENHPEAKKFYPGVFECPVVFRTTFDLYQRAATNPAQVARTLEATVLHNFAVSNRSGIFVYKDESGAIFYMELQPRGSGVDADGQVELLVYGINDPGPSVTSQLRVLLQRRLLLIAVDMLSNVLTKNPHFKWRQADIAFLRSFGAEWQKLDNNKVDKARQYRYFKFPKSVDDPCMVLLFLRQNLCGSTFFHRLNDIDQNGHNPSPAITAPDIDNWFNGTTLRMNQHEFSLYYNNAPSKLEPAFQGFSTLTEKGAEYCRQTGTGLAMIEFTLVRANGGTVDEVDFAKPASILPDQEQEPSSLRMEHLPIYPINREDRSICARVKITDTALNIDALHDWIGLTLNQALVAWMTERYLERSLHCAMGHSLCLFSEKSGTDKTIMSKMRQKQVVHRLCPGLPTVMDVLESAHKLPHPDIGLHDSRGVTKSSSVASLTLFLLERCILGPLVEQKRFGNPHVDSNLHLPLLEQLKKGVKIIRISRSHQPLSVRLEWSDPEHSKAAVFSDNNMSQTIEDSPVDCPEYLCFFSISERDEEFAKIDGSLRLYREVIVHDRMSEKSTSIDLLQSIKERCPLAFVRSFAFVFSVKRNIRKLWTYNWNPQIVKSISTVLREADNATVTKSGQVSHELQMRSLGVLSPGRMEAKPKKLKHQPSQKQEANKGSKESLVETEGTSETFSVAPPVRRIRRPTTIRRPKLIGKSVEGAALQAVAASRKRASSNQFKNKMGPASGIKGVRGTVSRELPKSGAVLSGSTRGTISSSEERSSESKRQISRDHDEKLTRVQIDYLNLLVAKRQQECVQSSLHQSSRLLLADIWWPRDNSQHIPQSVAKLLVSTAPKGWSDTCALLPIPGGMSQIFISTFARWIAALSTGLEMASLQPSVVSPDEVLLCSAIRNVRGSKCCAIVKISLLRNSISRQNSTAVMTEGWVLNLPRRSVASQRRKADANLRSSALMEKDSAGIDMLLTETHRSIGLERLLFDFSASMIERAVRLYDQRIKFEDLVPTLRELIARYPYERQKRVPQLNYRAFEGTIVLKSYGDSVIDKFDAKTLFERLCMEADSRDMLVCGAEALCFKKSISVKGSHSVCFITLHPTDLGKLQLVMLCRTQGVKLSDFMFREESNVAIHILDNIAFECGCIAHKELHHVAELLLTDHLWKSLASTSLLPKTGPSLQASPRAEPSVKETLNELSQLVYVRSLINLAATVVWGATNVTGLGDAGFLFSDRLRLDWKMICANMKRCTAFSPCKSFMESKSSTVNIYYMKDHDVFVKLEIGSKSPSSLLRAEIMEKEFNPGTAEAVLETFTNFVLNFIWHVLL